MDCQSIDLVRLFFFFHSFLSNEHRVLQYDDVDDNTEARAWSNVIGCIDIADAIRQSATFSSVVCPLPTMTSFRMREAKRKSTSGIEKKSVKIHLLKRTLKKKRHNSTRLLAHVHRNECNVCTLVLCLTQYYLSV